MAQTVANLTSVLKDVWTSDRVAKQFYNKNPLLDKMTAVSATMIGLQAQVPIHKYRSGGFTSTGPAGGVLNPAGNQQTDQAIYTLVYNWFQISIETAALNQSGSSLQSIIAGKDLEMQGAVDDVSKHVSRQIASNGDGLIAQCTTGGASTTVNLLPQASGGVGYDAIVRGWLYPGLPVDIGTTADTDVLATGAVITDVGEDPVTPTITTGTSVTTTSSHYISIANPNSATAANPELNGLRNIVSTTTTLGGINPATAGEGFWKAALVDSTTSSLSLDLMVNAQRAVYQKRGDWMTDVVTSPKQAANFYLLLQNQVRFGGDTGLSAGNVGDAQKGNAWNGNGITVIPDIVDKEMYFLTLADFCRITGSIKQPTWTSDLEGAGGNVRWGQGTTAFNEGLVFPLQVGVQRRNTQAALTNLVA
jgi:hypothetical protein